MYYINEVRRFDAGGVLSGGESGALLARLTCCMAGRAGRAYSRP